MNVQGARYREILDGRLISGEVDTVEHADAPSIWPLLSAAVFAPFLWGTKSVLATLVITDFVFPMFIFSAFFLLLNRLTRAPLAALLAAYIFMLFPELAVLFPPGSVSELKTLVLQFLPFLPETPVVHLLYLRREAFIPGAPFFILTLYGLHRVLTTREKKWTILAGVFFGSLFYFYLYYWIFIGITLGTLIVVSALRRDGRTSALLSVGLVALAVSVPFWVSHQRLANLPQYGELAGRAGIEIGRAVRLHLWPTYLLYAGMAALALWLGDKLKRQSESILVAAVLAAEIISYNIQVITGFNIQSDHWSGRVFVSAQSFVVAALAWYAVRYALERYPAWAVRARMAGLAVLVAGASSLSLHVVRHHFRVESASAAIYTVPSELMAAYDWLNLNTPVDSVVLSPALETNIDLAVYTHNKLFLARAQNTIAGEEEILDRMHAAYALGAVSPEYLNALLGTERGIMYFFSVSYESRALDRYLRPDRYPGLALPAAVRSRVIQDYSQYALPAVMPYRVEYIFIGPREKEMGFSRPRLAGYPKIYDEGGVEIYFFSD